MSTFSVVSPSLVVADCSECRGVRTVFFGTCEVCFAEFGELDDDPQPWRDRPPLSQPSERVPATRDPAKAEPFAR